MSVSSAPPPPDVRRDGPSPPAEPVTTAVEFHYSQTDNFPALLQQLNVSLLATTYQANKLLVVRAAGSGLSTLVRTFDQPMGLALAGRRMAVGARNQIWFLRDAPDIAPRIEPFGVHDACYLPRACHVTGDIRCHEIAWAGEELWIVNTRFSCLCTLEADYSFVPRWRPPFVTALAAEDRCHLNGLAMENDRPRYVTALGETDTQGGWRPDRAKGGCLIDVPSGEVVARGLSMPHSPRLDDGRLWVLESGAGRLVRVDPASGLRETVADLPGFGRGLAFAGHYAFIGLSKIRETSTFGGLPIAERLSELKCGVAVVDLQSGRVIAMLDFHTAVEEIFDVQLLPALRFPEVIGFQKEAVHHTFVVPREQVPLRREAESLLNQPAAKTESQTQTPKSGRRDPYDQVSSPPAQASSRRSVCAPTMTFSLYRRPTQKRRIVMRFANLRTAIVLGAALALAIGVGAACAGAGDVVIQAYADDEVVDVLVEAVIDPNSSEGQEVIANGIANPIYVIDNTDEYGNPVQGINHVIGIPLGAPDGDTYNPYWELIFITITDTDVSYPLTSFEAVESLNFSVDNSVYVLCPEISVP